MEISIIPKFIINRLVSDSRDQIHINIFLSSILLFIFFIFIGHFVDIISRLPHFCLFQKIFGIPCPGCGITRSLIAISELNFVSSWHYNPVGMFILLFIFIQIPLRIFAMTFKNMEGLMCLFSKILNCLIVSSLLLVWIVRVI